MLKVAFATSDFVMADGLIITLDISTPKTHKRKQCVKLIMSDDIDEDFRERIITQVKKTNAETGGGKFTFHRLVAGADEPSEPNPGTTLWLAYLKCADTGASGYYALRPLALKIVKD